MNLASIYVSLLSLVLGSSPEKPSLDTVHQWNLLDFGFPTSNDRQEALDNGNLVPASAIPIEVAPQYFDDGSRRVFVTIPRFSTGIPYSLATISNDSKTLQPYPKYNWHSSHGDDCDGITSAFRVALTPCNQMWVIDSGRIGGVQHCAPQLLVFDLNTDSLVHRYRFPEKDYIPRASLLITPVIKVDDPAPKGSCERTTVYIADVNNHGLVVYDKAQNASWRVEHRFMYPDPDFGVHTIANESFTLMDGIFGLSVVEPNLYFHPIASKSEYKVPLSTLNDSAAFDAFVGAHADDFELVGERKSECSIQTADSKGNIFCVTMNPIALTSWNVKKPYKTLTELSTDEDVLQFVSGMKVVKNKEGKEELWMLSNRFQKYYGGTLDSTEVNYRILKRQIDDL